MNLRYRWSHPTCREKGWKCDEICFVFTHTLTMQKRSVFVGSTPEDSDERRGETNINWVRGLGRPCPLLALLFVYTYIIYIYVINNNIFNFCKRKEREKKLVEDAVEPTSKGGGLCDCVPGGGWRAPHHFLLSKVLFITLIGTHFLIHFISVLLPARVFY